MDRRSATHIDENDPRCREMAPNLRNPTTLRTKKFISPNKTNFPRKKILAERNESPVSNLSNTQVPKSQILDPKPSNFDSEATPKHLSAETCPEKSGDDKSSCPYDPQMNYLSPRPQFLRYNPNRRREIFQRLENEARGLDSLSSMSSSCASSDSDKAMDEDPDTSIDHNSSSSEAGSWESEGEESDGESDEETEERKGWSFRGVLKILLLLVILAFSISSMDSPGRKPFDGFKHGDEMMQNLEDGDGFFGEEETEIVVFGLDSEMVKRDLTSRDESSEPAELIDAAADEVIKTGENPGWFVEQSQHEEQTMEDMESIQVPDQIIGNVELHGKELVENAKAIHGDEAEIFPAVLDDQQNASDSAIAVEKGGTATESIRDEEAQRENMVDGEVAASTENGVSELEMVDKYSNSLESFNSGEEKTPEMRLVRHLGAESVTGILTCFAIVVTSVLRFCSKRERTMKKNLHLVEERSAKTVVATDEREVHMRTMREEEASFVLGMDRPDHNTRVASLANPKPLVNFWQEDMTRTQRQTPSIELLGELSVAEISKSLRSCDMKMKEKDGESHYSPVSAENRFAHSSAQSGPIHARTKVSLFSTANPTTYGNFTAGKRSESMAARNLEVTKEVITPLRRSARIRSRVVASP